MNENRDGNNPDTWTPGVKSEMELASHFAGKRTGRRTLCDFEGEIHSAGQVYPVQGVDLSRSGALVRVLDERLRWKESEAGLLMYGTEVERRLGAGFRILLAAGTLRLRARLVRVVLKDGEPLLGCHFARPLPSEACLLFGVDPAGPDIV